MHVWDAVVVGCGGMGGAAAYHLARRGVKVLAVERFSVGHDRGSSHGQTRIIRRAYFEHPSYVPLVNRAYELWGDLEAECGVTLVNRTGLVLFGPDDGVILSGVRRTVACHDIAIEEVAGDEFKDRFGRPDVAENWSAVYEADAGFLSVDACVRAHVRCAEACGATVLPGVAVRSFEVVGSDVLITTDDGQRLCTRSLVVCAGAWSADMLASMRLPLEVRRKVVCWFKPNDSRYDVNSGCPVFGFDVAPQFFYGFPDLDGRGVKVGLHMGGDVARSADVVDRVVNDHDIATVRKFTRRYLPGLSDEVSDASVCLYTMTPDEHFIVDRHREYGQVAFAAGFSGHGFKFAPIIGSVLADWVTTGSTSEPVEFLSAERAALRT